MINMFHFPNFEDMTMLQNGQKLDQFDKIIFRLFPIISISQNFSKFFSSHRKK